MTTFNKGDLIVALEPYSDQLDVLKITDIRGAAYLIWDTLKYRGARSLQELEQCFRHATDWEAFITDWQYEYKRTHKWDDNPYNVTLEESLAILFTKYSEDLEITFPAPFEDPFEGFMKSFRQIDIIEEPGMDSLIWNLLHQVSAFRVAYERHMKRNKD